MQRLRVRCSAAAFGLAAVVTILLAGRMVRAVAEEPVRVGYLGPLTGIFAQAGRDMLDGLRLGLEQSGWRAGGRKIELIEEDDQANPGVALAKYRKLVQQDRIHVLAGVLLVNIGYTLAQPIAQDRLPSLFVTTPDDLTKRRPVPWIVRTTFSASQPMHALGDYASRALKYRKVVAIAADLAFGYECVGGFQRVFEEGGGRVVQKVWVPPNAMDFSPFLSQLPRDADAVVAVFAAAQAVQFVKQYAQQGLKARWPLLGAPPLADDHTLPAMGDDAVGVITAHMWTQALANPANQAFLQLAEARLKVLPGAFNAMMYSGARWIVEATEAVSGRVEDREKFVDALRRASEKVPDPRGPVKVDEYGNPTQNIYILKVEKAAGRVQNDVIYTYPMVSQFWNYKPEDFLRTPAYDRTYPPLKP